ncbi:Asp-tRNA(Asn)/Glu-tRNA(Gln) amidotransferase subunit GatA [Lyticum sinuosum]|uniref:Glutamyl-tRNA(Gln) amidotransferase subunit A n=1 Tax=Lyticum sinuosum TaxID=1332059 RepID=A0AAE5AHX1_9RICK|nr:Asp-tRNA(Asn)/Glu-tRNA(Gln) amidotransferase subunit GatA [Lyticum sinuosum]MDZ5761284.1 Glutamyl-tRNA(Gln) amidotransferase subunit A [Lyticum sinuosum]
MNDYIFLSISEVSELLRSREISASDLAEAYISLAEKFKYMNAFITIDYDAIRASAIESDNRLRKDSDEINLLEGIPIAIKDLFCTQNELTTAGSAMLRNFRSPYESTVTYKLKKSGAIPFGKTNMDEFAMGSDNSYSYFGPVISPWKNSQFPDKKIVPGGSSGGSAAAVASYQCMAALGSDTGGSVRQPAAFSGLVGVKPTYGRCSRWGMIAFASSLDQAGVLTRSVLDAALILDVITGYDEKDQTSLNFESTRCTDVLKSNCSIRGLKIGIPSDYKIAGMSEDIIRMWEKAEDWLKEEGAEIVPINLPNTSVGISVYYVIAPAEASSNLARYDGIRYGERATRSGQTFNEMVAETRSQFFGNEVKRRIMIGTYVLSAGTYDKYYGQAQKVRHIIAQDFKNAFEVVDAILTPTAPTPAYSLGENQDNPATIYMNDAFTVPTSLAGLPAISVPCGLSEKEQLPLGLQVIGNYCQEDIIFKVAFALEKNANFSRNRLINDLFK